MKHILKKLILLVRNLLFFHMYLFRTVFGYFTLTTLEAHAFEIIRKYLYDIQYLNVCLCIVKLFCYAAFFSI